jgi:predicted PurR-regulated permease PerM
MDDTARSRLQRLAILLGTASFFLVILIVFREVLVPFIVAVVLAYVLNPAVEWIHRRPIRKRYIPRWTAVLLIYLMLFGALGIFVTTMLPRLGVETAALVRAVPGYISQFRDEFVPSTERWIGEGIGHFFRPPGWREEDQDEPDLSVTTAGDAEAGAGEAPIEPHSPPSEPSRPIHLTSRIDDAGVVPLIDGGPSTDADVDPAEPIRDSTSEAIAADSEGAADSGSPGSDADLASRAQDQAAPSIWSRIWGSRRADRNSISAADAGSEVTHETRPEAAELISAPDAGLALADEPDDLPLPTADQQPQAHNGQDVAQRGGEDGPELVSRGAIMIRPVRGGGYEIELPEEGLIIEQMNDGQYRIGAPRVRMGQGTLNIRRQLDDVVERILEQGEHHAVSALRFTQQAIFITVEFVFSAVLSLMLAGFILATTPTIMDFFRSLFPPRIRIDFDQLVTKVDNGLGGVIRGQLIICLINGILSGIGFAIAGLRYWPVWTLLATIASIVPIFGTIVSSVPAIAIGLTQGWGTGLFVFIWIVGIHELEANVFNPKIMGDAAKMHPVIVIFALLSGAHAGGILGALLGVPVASILQSLFKFLRDRAYADEEREQPLPLCVSRDEDTDPPAVTTGSDDVVTSEPPQSDGV